MVMRVERHRALSSAVSLVALVVLACGEPTAPSAAPPPSVSAEPPSPVAERVFTPPSNIPRAEVDALITGWLDAQNRGAFEAYQALYATRFQGIRRTARTELRLDRDAWMEDRRRLFGRPMEVAASDVVVALTPTTAVARLTQRWSSGRYSEEGPKRIVMVREGGSLRIAAEEMIAARPVAAARRGAGVVFPAFQTEGSTLVILGEAPAPGAGAPRLVAAERVHVALTEAESMIPTELAALRGRALQLVGEHGVCVATITSLGVAALVVPHFGTANQWAGQDFDDSTPPVVTPPARIAQEVVAMAEHHYWVGITDVSTCGRVDTAVVGERAPQVWPLQERPETSAAVATRLFAGELLRELVSELREGKRADDDEAGDEPNDDDASLEAELRAALVVQERALDLDVSVIEARLHIPGECGGHDRVFFFTRAGEALTRLELSAWSSIESVYDVEGDGTPELAVSDHFGNARGIVRLGAMPATLAEWRISNFDCGC